MSYPKKHPVNVNPKAKAANPPANSRLTEEKREKLLAIQEREQLKGLLVNKFLEKYGKEKKANQDYVNKQVNEFMKNEKLTEENLKKLEQKIKDGTGAKGPVSQKADDAKSQASVAQSKNEASLHQVGQGQSAHHHHHHHHHDHDHDDAISVTSSNKPISVYNQGDSDDEWATMMKYDTELYKKEKTLEKVREQEQKKRIKAELDRQIEEKKRVQAQESGEMGKYNQLVQEQMKTFDRKENKREQEMKNKIMQEKASRDKQLADENARRKADKKQEKAMDELLVTKIKQELDEEARIAAVRRQQDKESLKRVLFENEEYKKKMLEEAKREKEADIRAQQEYTRLIEKQEADRAAELKAREDRAKKFMNMMADTVVKDQKAQILDEERKLLKHVLDKESREMEDEKMRQQRLNDQKKDMRKFLDGQMEEKERKREEEAALERKQAEIWKKDTSDYNEHEKQKHDYIRDVNKQHAEVLKKQIEQERRKNKKMSTEEMLLNKPKLKEIAHKVDDVKIQKQLVNPHAH